MRLRFRLLALLLSLPFAVAGTSPASAASETAPASAPATTSASPPLAPASLPAPASAPTTLPLSAETPAPLLRLPSLPVPYRPYLIASLSHAVLFDAFEGRVHAYNFIAARFALLVHRHLALAFTRLWAPLETRTTGTAYLGGLKAVVGLYPRNLFGTLEAGFIFTRVRTSGSRVPRFNNGGGGAIDEHAGLYATAGMAWRFHRFFSAYTDATLTFVRFPSEDLSFGWLGLMVTSGVAFTFGANAPPRAAAPVAAAPAPRAPSGAFRRPWLVLSAGPAVMGDVTPSHGAWVLPLVFLRVASPFTPLGGPAFGVYWGPIAARAPAPVATGQHLTAMAFTLGWRFARPFARRFVGTLEAGGLLALVHNAIDGDRDEMGRLLWQSLDKTTHAGVYGGAGIAFRVDRRFSVYLDAQLTATLLPIDDGRFGRFGLIVGTGLALTL